MKCIRCEADANKQDREAEGNRCPSCRHPFVTTPDTDRMTDRMIQSAIEAVSGDGTFFYLPSHVEYETRPPQLRKARRAGIGCAVCAVIVLAFGFLGFWHGGGWFVVVGIAGLIGLGSLIVRGQYRKAPASRDILRRWYEVNPDEKLVQPGRLTGDHELPAEEISFDRVLVCDRNAYVDFFLANLFHFHYSCPVLGGKKYPEHIVPRLLPVLKQNPDLEVFLIHDHTPTGRAFASKMRRDSEWFGDHPAEKIVDLGLTAEQERLFSHLARPLAEISGEDASTDELGAELTVFRPEILIQLCGQGLSEKCPFHLLPAAMLTDSSTGYG